MTALRWDVFLARWRARSEQAERASERLRAGEDGPARALLQHWRLDALPAAWPVLRARLLAFGGASRGTGLGRGPWPSLALEADPFELWVRLHEADPAGADPPDLLAWALLALANIGERLETLERDAWGVAPGEAAEGKDDFEVAGLWTGWCNDRFWRDRPAWERRYLELAQGCVRGVCEARRLPEHVARRACKDLSEQFFYVLIGEREGVPGWLDVALRVIERDPAGPVAALARLLPRAAWDDVSACLAVRGYWPDTLIALLPGRPRASDRAAALAEACRADPRTFEALLDLHVALRLLSLWSEGPQHRHPRAAWTVLRQNRGRARGRLRALLARDRRSSLLEALLHQPRLARLTRDAMGVFWTSWAWHALRRDFPGSATNAVTPPCKRPGEDLEPLGAELAGLVRTWVLLVSLRGCQPRLDRWLTRGGVDGDDEFYKLLERTLPDELRDGADQRGAYRRLRAALSLSLNEHLTVLLPTLRVLTELQGGRALPGRFQTALDPVWDDRVPRPRRGFNDMQANARALLSAQGPSEEEPWNPSGT